MTDGELWKLYRQQLLALLGRAEDKYYKDTPSCSIADWEALDITGLPSVADPKAAIQSRFFWADSMPLWSSPSYQRGNGFHDMYRAFLGSIVQDPAVAAAKAKVNEVRMPQGVATLDSYPAYSISPSLKGWHVAALQSVASGQPPMLDITVRYPVQELAMVADGSIHTADAVLADEGPFVSYVPALPSKLRAGKDAPSGSRLFDIAKVLRDAEHSNDEAPSLRFTAQSVQTFEVMAGAWYDSSMLLYSTRVRPDSVLSGRPLFGKDGVLNLRTAQLVVVMGRSLTIRGAESCTSGLCGVQEEGGTLKAGGFSFKLTDQHTSVAPSDSDSSVTLRDNIAAPYVIGVVVSELS